MSFLGENREEEGEEGKFRPHRKTISSNFGLRSVQNLSVKLTFRGHLKKTLWEISVYFAKWPTHHL